MEKIDELIKKVCKEKKAFLFDILDLGLSYEDYNLLIHFLESKGIKVIENYVNNNNKQDFNINYDDDLQKQYINEIIQIPLLSEQEEKELFYEYRRTRDSYIRERLICCNLRLVLKIAFEYKWRLKNNSYEIVDLIQEGNKGLIKAIEKYDVSLGNKFAVYAPWWIRHAMKTFLNDMTGQIKLPTYVSETYWSIQRRKRDIKKETGKNVSDYEVASLLGISDKRAESIIEKAGYNFFSIDESVLNDPQKTNHEFIGDMEQINIEELVINKVEFEIIEKIMKTKLTEKEYFVVSCRNGIINDVNKFPGVKKMQEIGNMIGTSRQRVEQILKDAYKKIREEYERQIEEQSLRVNIKTKKI